MAQKPLTKTQANAAFLKQANHFTRLGTPSKIDTELLLNSLSALLAIHGQKVGFKFEGDAVGGFEPVPELTAALEQYMPQMRNLVDVSAHPVVDWSKAPKGATHYTIKESGAIWFKNINGFWTIYDSGVWYAIGLPTSDLIPSPTSTAIPELKKLTQAVFDGLPKEYRWAAVDSNQSCWVSSKKPERTDECQWIFGNVSVASLKSVGGAFDATDWQNSLIERLDVSAHPVVDWSQAPEGATHYVVESYSHHWQKKESGQWSFFDEAHKVWVLYVFQPPCYDYVTIIPRPVTKPTRPEPIEALSLSVRAQHLLLSAGILTIPDLTTKTESELLRIKGLGKKSLAEIVEALKRHVGGQTA